ncbi:MAG: hypothetical protein GXP26_16340 [Planctomycetes bacterium]|nr:hypothetical protein [Planctomycetota bacterium]
MQLRWKASFSATCLHAAACLSEGFSVADQALATNLQPAADGLLRELNACGLPVEKTLSLLVSLAAEYENNRDLIEVTATRIVGAGSLGDASISRLAGCVADLETALLRQSPALVDDLVVRGRPLREQWDARGPGLMRQVARLTEQSFLASECEIVLVAPIVGGHGRPHLRNNRVTFEAVLANPHATLPETLRLGWLLAQLNLDLPCYSDLIAGPRLPQVAQLATVPLILSAAETVELTTLSPETLSEALTCWHLPTDKADQLHQWWDTYATGNTRWAVALAALDTMING